MRGLTLGLLAIDACARALAIRATACGIRVVATSDIASPTSWSSNANDGNHSSQSELYHLYRRIDWLYFPVRKRE